MAQAPRGTRDFDPDQMAVRLDVARRMRRVFRDFGYREIQTPTFEEVELFTAKSGEGIISELYDFEDKGGRHLTLRPELTAPVMRMYHTDHTHDPKPIKWSYFGNCFRYDRPQKGRYREFWQFGCEQIGAGTPVAMAELIALADAVLASSGIRDYDLRVGHVDVLGGLVDALGLSKEDRGAAMRAIDKRDDAALADVCRHANAPEESLVTLLAAMDAADLDEARQRVGDHPGLDELDAVFTHLEWLGVDAGINLGIARGLDYYTGVVFEIHCPALEAQSQLVGGGAYDLSGVFGAQPVPTIGFGLGFDRTLVAIEAEGQTLEVEDRPVVYFGALGDEAKGVIVRGTARLRRMGVWAEMDLIGRKPAQIAKAADACGAQFLCILGDRDLEAGKVQVKDLSTGEARELDIGGVVDWLAEQTGEIDLRDYN